MPKPQPLDRVLAAARAGQLAEVLEGLLDAWAMTPAVALADLIAAVSAQVRTTPLGLRGKRAVLPWQKLAAHATACELPALYETLFDAYPNQAAARLALLRRPDPRLDETLVGLLEGRYAVLRGFDNTRRRLADQFWRDAVARVLRIHDPRLLARLRACVAGVWWAPDERDPVLGWAARAKPPPPAPAAVAEIAQLVGLQITPARRDLAPLEHAVYADPEDDGARLVYADALGEEGDPRGELIASQLVANRSDAQRTRERRLVATHGAAWLGPLADVLGDGYRFERGFLDACEIALDKREAARRLAGDPRWATVRELRRAPLALALDPVMRSLRVLDAVGADATPWPELFRGTPRAIEELHYQTVHRADTGRLDPQEVAALCSCEALPRLRALRLQTDFPLIAKRLARAPVLARLESLELYDPNYGADVAAALASLIGAPVVRRLVVQLDHFRPVRLVLENGDAELRLGMRKAAWSELWEARAADEACALIAALPRCKLELHTGNLSARFVRQVRATARRLG